MTISRRNLSGQEFSLTGDTVFEDCNGVEARIVTNGFQFSKVRGNWRGWYLDGVKQDSWAKPPILFPDSLVLSIRQRFMEAAEKDIIAAIEWLADYVSSHPTATQTQAKTAWAAYSTSTGNIIYFDLCVTWFVKNYLPAGSQTWAALRTLLLSKTLPAWRGEDVNGE